MRNSWRKLYQIAIIAAGAMLTVCCGFSPAAAQDSNQVQVALSSREAYVGMPLVMQLSIQNAQNYDLPATPEIDGCEVREAGSPSQSSQVTIINGRRSESRQISMRYLITPKRTGEFVVPAMRLKVDGRSVSTTPLRFVATKSETGDLLFVEIEGGSKQVYVGERLDLKLRIWLRPFRDPENNVQLSASQMWQLISDQTSWGCLSDRMQTLAENNQRPRAEEVLRADDEGNSHSYYLYEVDATIYPTRPGSIDASDIHVVVNYPTAVQRARDPFEGFFRDSPFGGSRLKQMMDDDFFASPFRNRLSISSYRPIVADAKVDATTVLPIPTAGRPADYRGAVGQYRMIADAFPKTVPAGDPITLNLGIAGTGPMELVQAPPLAEIATLADDFKVPQQPLAGFTDGDSKVFSTTIRPRHDGVTKIPAIPFSYFDPVKREYQTVYSEPIEITVTPAETLSLDAIVGKGQSPRAGRQAASLGPDLENRSDAGLLAHQTPAGSSPLWIIGIIAPPLVWLAAVLVGSRARTGKYLARWQPAKSRCQRRIDHAASTQACLAAVATFVGKRTRRPVASGAEAVGALRLAGFRTLATRLESFFDSIEKQHFRQDDQELARVQARAHEFVNEIDQQLNERQQTQLVRARSGRARSLASLLTVALVCHFLSAQQLQAAEEGTQYFVSSSTLRLSSEQRKQVLEEANAAYRLGRELTESDTAEAHGYFATAREKYQLLVDAGVRNAGLYLNLGNASLQTGKIGLAIASYRRGLQLTPSDRQIACNLRYAESQVKRDGVAASPTEHGLARHLQAGKQRLIGWVSPRTWKLLCVLSSISFWGILIIHQAGFSRWRKRYALIPLALLLLTAWPVYMSNLSTDTQAIAIVVADEIVVRTGDGHGYPEIFSIRDSDGLTVERLMSRREWTLIRTSKGQEGWVVNTHIEVI